MPKQALELAVERGATAGREPARAGELDIPAIEGIGGSYLYLVDRYGAEQIYDVGFRAGAGRRRATTTASACTRSTISPTM